MVYYNLKVAISPLFEMKSEETYEKISKLISQAMLEDENLKKLHETNTYKMYVFCNLYPIAKDNIYKMGNIYTFDLRCLELTFAVKMKQFLKYVPNKMFKVIDVNMESSEQRKITKLITLTPAVITTPEGNYNIKEDMELVKKRILDGAQKKYEMLHHQKTEVDFIKSIQKTNRKPYKIPYKNMSFLANKFVIEINEDAVSQDLAYIMLSTGVLEKNAIGMGFCKAM